MARTSTATVTESGANDSSDLLPPCAQAKGFFLPFMAGRLPIRSREWSGRKICCPPPVALKSQRRSVVCSGQTSASGNSYITSHWAP